MEWEALGVDRDSPRVTGCSSCSEPPRGGLDSHFQLCYIQTPFGQDPAYSLWLHVVGQTVTRLSLGVCALVIVSWQVLSFFL